MYKFVFVSVVALVVFQGIIAKPQGKAQKVAQPVAKSDIDVLAEKARELVQNVSHTIEGNLPDSKQVSDSLTQASQTFATKVKDVVDDLAKQTSEHKGDLENLLNSVKENLKATATKLENSIGPDAAKTANNLKAAIEENLNNALTEAKRLAKAAEPEVGKLQAELNTSAKKMLDNIIETTNTLKDKLKDNAGAKN